MSIKLGGRRKNGDFYESLDDDKEEQEKEEQVFIDSDIDEEEIVNIVFDNIIDVSDTHLLPYFAWDNVGSIAADIRKWKNDVRYAAW